MTKLKIRQYWSQHGKPWYVIRYGHSPRDYFTAVNNNLDYWVEQALWIADGKNILGSH